MTVLWIGSVKIKDTNFAVIEQSSTKTIYKKIYMQFFCQRYLKGYLSRQHSFVLGVTAEKMSFTVIYHLSPCLPTIRAVHAPIDAARY